MGIETSATQQKRAEKVSRMRKYFGNTERPEIHEWSVGDESLDFKTMSDAEVAEYLKK